MTPISLVIYLGSMLTDSSIPFPAAAKGSYLGMDGPGDQSMSPQGRFACRAASTSTGTIPGEYGDAIDVITVAIPSGLFLA